MDLTIYVLDCGDLFFQLFNIIAAFMDSSNFMNLVGMAAAFGLFVAMLRFFKSYDPNTIVKWFVMYMLVLNIAIIPKTTVVIADVSTQKNYPVSNVPLVFAFVAQGLTCFGYGLAQIFDSLFSTLNDAPASVQYSKTGFLFGSRLIQESRNFRVVNPVLKADLTMYFKRCVVGDVYLNHVLSPTELKESTNIWESISASPSKIRRTYIANENGERDNKSCAEATPILKTRLDKEIKRAYTIFGINLFGKPKGTNYEQLFNTHLNNAFNYYQGIQTTGTNAFLQAMMLNVIKDGISDYQSYLNSTASIMSHEFTKSQVQQRYSWELAGLKAAWIWPFFHSVVMMLLIALFPLIVLFAIAYNGIDGLKSYLMFFLSLQLWPALFAVLNFAMAFYGSSVTSNYGALNLANLDNVEQLHGEVASVAGYMMLFIPWLANGIVKRIGETFNSLSQSMVSGVQSSSMAAASEAANASFSLGQTSFYNATGNTLSANKHDSNFTSMAGNTTRMLDSGATVTTNRDGTDVIDASSTISRGTTSLNSSQAINGMLSDAAEMNTQAISSKSKQLSSLVSEGMNQLTQFSNLSGKDIRLGDGVSESDTSQVQKAVSNVLGMASNVAQRTGVSTEQALTGIVSAGVAAQAGVNSQHSLIGKGVSLLTGADGSLYARANYEKSDSTAQRANDGFEKVLDAKQMQDFRSDYSFMQNFSQTHHLDSSHSKGASLLSQGASDLRQAQNISSSLDENYSKAERIAHAKSVTESGGATINQNMDQMFQEFVTEKVGKQQRNYLYGHAGDSNAQATLSNLANQFVSDEGIRNKIIDTYGNTKHQINPESRFGAGSNAIQSREKELYSNYSSNKNSLESQSSKHDVGFNEDKAQALQNKVQDGITSQKNAISTSKGGIELNTKIQAADADIRIMKGRETSHAKSIIKGE